MGEIVFFIGSRRGVVIDDGRPNCTFSSCCLPSRSACASNASVKIRASSLRSDNAAFHDLARKLKNGLLEAEISRGKEPVVAPRGSFGLVGEVGTDPLIFLCIFEVGRNDEVRAGRVRSPLAIDCASGDLRSGEFEADV